MKGLGYRVGARILDAQWLGVPQHRERVIFVGVRKDLKTDPLFPSPLSYRYSVRDAIGDVVSLDRTAWGGRSDSADGCAPTIAIAKGLDVVIAGQAEKDIDENRPLRTVLATHTDYSGRALSDGYKASSVELPSRTVRAGRCVSVEGLQTIRRRLTIPEVRRLCSFPDDFELPGSYAKQWARLGNAVPPMMAYHIATAVKRSLCA